MIDDKQKKEFILRLSGKKFGGEILNCVLYDNGGIHGNILNTCKTNNKNTYSSNIYLPSNLIEYINDDYVVTNYLNHNHYYIIAK